MATMLIAYDLGKPNQNYRAIAEEIKSIAAGHGWWHHLDSTWLVRTTLDQRAIRDRLKPLLDEGDELLVIDVSNSSRAWTGFADRGSKWLKKPW